MQGVPLQFSDEKDRARFRHLEQLPGVELYHAHISRYAFEPHTHEAFGIGVIEQGAERFRYRGSQHIAAANSIVTMNPDELHTGEAETADGWRYRMIYLEPDRLEAITGVRDWWFSEVVREDPLRSRQIGQLIYGLWHSDDPLAQQGLLLDLIDASALWPTMPLRKVRPGIALTACATTCTITICVPSPSTSWRRWRR